MEDEETMFTKSTDKDSKEWDWQGHEDHGDDEYWESIDPATLTDYVPTTQDQVRDPELKLIVNALTGDPRIARDRREAARDNYVLKADCLYRRVVTCAGVPGLAACIPQHARGAVLSRLHYSLPDGGGHGGGKQLYDAARDSYYWPTMKGECEAFCAACHRCGETKSTPTIKVPNATAPTPTAPFQVIHVDHKGVLPMSEGYTHCLVVVCALTRFTLYIPVRDTKGATTFRALHDHVFSIFGYPLVIVSDNGTAFANKLMAASEKLFGYRQIFVKPHTPQANGLAEAAVKKFKLIIDRHTKEYEGWSKLAPMATATVNQRTTAGHGSKPFVALFGRQPVTLAALEQPSLLPTTTPAETEIAELAARMKLLDERLRRESDNIKEAAVHAHAAKHAHCPSQRAVVPGDRIWLTFSDSERARYLRKHGHGKPWKHSFKVLQVRPHAVLLDLPKDGSVPDVIPWQSLRKCSYAPRHFHRDDLPRPQTDEHGRVVVDDADPVSDDDDAPVDDGSNGYSSWSPDALYEIERIVSAKRVGAGWRLMVKWKGYPEATPEALSKILQQTKHPDILADIERCKMDFDATHKHSVPDPEGDSPSPNDAMLVQSVLLAHADMAPTLSCSTHEAMQSLRRRVRTRAHAMQLLSCDAHDDSDLLSFLCPSV